MATAFFSGGHGVREREVSDTDIRLVTDLISGGKLSDVGDGGG